MIITIILIISYVRLTARRLEIKLCRSATVGPGATRDVYVGPGASEGCRGSAQRPQ